MSDDTTFKLSLVLVLSILALGILFGVALGIGTYKTLYPPNPPTYIPFVYPEVTVTSPDCSIKEIGLGGSIYDKVFLYTCGDSNWLAIVHENGTVTWSKAP